MDQSAPYNWERALRGTDNETVARPLWEYPPDARTAVLSERRRRHLLQFDPEPTGDPEYA
ncbi:hypothetical protein ACWGA9_06230 [Streptomyces sp. NPDC054950]